MPHANSETPGNLRPRAEGDPKPEELNTIENFEWFESNGKIWFDYPCAPLGSFTVVGRIVADGIIYSLV